LTRILYSTIEYYCINVVLCKLINIYIYLPLMTLVKIYPYTTVDISIISII